MPNLNPEYEEEFGSIYKSMVEIDSKSRCTAKKLYKEVNEKYNQFKKKISESSPNKLPKDMNIYNKAQIISPIFKSSKIPLQDEKELYNEFQTLFNNLKYIECRNVLIKIKSKKEFEITFFVLKAKYYFLYSRYQKALNCLKQIQLDKLIDKKYDFLKYEYFRILMESNLFLFNLKLIPSIEIENIKDAIYYNDKSLDNENPNYLIIDEALSLYHYYFKNESLNSLNEIKGLIQKASNPNFDQSNLMKNKESEVARMKFILGQIYTKEYILSKNTEKYFSESINFFKPKEDFLKKISPYYGKALFLYGNMLVKKLSMSLPTSKESFQHPSSFQNSNISLNSNNESNPLIVRQNNSQNVSYNQEGNSVEEKSNNNDISLLKNDPYNNLTNSKFHGLILSQIEVKSSSVYIEESKGDNNNPYQMYYQATFHVRDRRSSIFYYLRLKMAEIFFYNKRIDLFHKIMNDLCLYLEDCSEDSTKIIILNKYAYFLNLMNKKEEAKEKLIVARLLKENFKNENLRIQYSLILSHNILSVDPSYLSSKERESCLKQSFEVIQENKSEAIKYAIMLIKNILNAYLYLKLPKEFIELAEKASKLIHDDYEILLTLANFWIDQKNTYKADTHISSIILSNIDNKYLGQLHYSSALGSLFFINENYSDASLYFSYCVELIDYVPDELTPEIIDTIYCNLVKALKRNIDEKDENRIYANKILQKILDDEKNFDNLPQFSKIAYSMKI